MGVYEDIKKALKEILVPELKDLQAGVKTLGDKMGSVEKEIHSLREELKVLIEIRERLAAIEARQGIRSLLKERVEKEKKSIGEKLKRPMPGQDI